MKNITDVMCFPSSSFFLSTDSDKINIEKAWGQVTQEPREWLESEGFIIVSGPICKELTRDLGWNDVEVGEEVVPGRAAAGYDHLTSL